MRLLLMALSAFADAELDDAAYDANMRSAASASLSETADRFPDSSDRSSSIGDASDSDADHSDGGVIRDVPQADAADAAGGSMTTAPHGDHKASAQRTRSWDDSVEEGMAKLDADPPLGADTDKRCESSLMSWLAPMTLRRHGPHCVHLT